MSLATRCTACGTVFRVVQDQLKVSEGWVRCGRCNDVFNALEGLFDLERDGPPGGPATSVADDNGPAVDAPSEPLAAAGSDTPDASFEPAATSVAAEAQSFGEKIDAQLIGSREAKHDSTPATRISERDRLDFPDAQFDPDMLAEDTVALQKSPASPTEETDDTAELEPAAPGFVRRAQRQARQQTGGMRALQASAAVVLLVGLGAQGAHHFRDSVSARWPVVSPALNAWCQLVGCAVNPPRRIDDVAVENTALARATIPDTFRLSVVLRNRGATAVATPSVDLSLTDVGGQLVARRVLAPNDFLSAPASIRPGAESGLQLLLGVDGARVAGYTVEVFYP